MREAGKKINMTEHYMRLGNGLIESMDMQSMAYGPDSEVYK